MVFNALTALKDWLRSHYLTSCAPIKLNGNTLECVDKFCYLGDMIGSDGGAEDASSMRVKYAWGKFRELSPVLTAKRASLKLKGKVYRICVQSVMIYGRETWAMKAD